MTGDTAHGDNVKAKFGTGDDGFVYSDGTNILVEGQNADSEVRLLSDDRVVIGSKAWGESFAICKRWRSNSLPRQLAQNSHHSHRH